jgi:hypothetical protein
MASPRGSGAISCWGWRIAPESDFYTKSGENGRKIVKKMLDLWPDI